MQPTNPTPQPQQPNFQQASQSAIQNANQPQQPSPSIDPQISESIIQRLQDQSSQIQQSQDQLGAKSDMQSMAANQYLKDKQTAISKALGSLNDKSTQGQVGRSIASPAYAGYCQQFADDQTGTTQRYPTAAATWQAKVADGSAQTDLSKAKPGDVIEFRPDSTNANLGHAAVVTSTKDGLQLQMATYQGVENYSLNDWKRFSGQVPEGFYSPK